MRAPCATAKHSPGSSQSGSPARPACAAPPPWRWPCCPPGTGTPPAPQCPCQPWSRSHCTTPGLQWQKNDGRRCVNKLSSMSNNQYDHLDLPIHMLFSYTAPQQSVTQSHPLVPRHQISMHIRRLASPTCVNWCCWCCRLRHWGGRRLWRSLHRCIWQCRSCCC